MQLKLHANATTTPRTRAYIQRSPAPVAALAAELGVGETTVRRWKARAQVHDIVSPRAQAPTVGLGVDALRVNRGAVGGRFEVHCGLEGAREVAAAGKANPRRD